MSRESAPNVQTAVAMMYRAIAEGTGRDYAMYRGGTGYKRSALSAKSYTTAKTRKQTAKSSRKANR